MTHWLVKNKSERREENSGLNHVPRRAVSLERWGNGGREPVCVWVGKKTWVWVWTFLVWGVGEMFMKKSCGGLWGRPGLEAWASWAGKARWSLGNGSSLKGEGGTKNFPGAESHPQGALPFREQEQWNEREKDQEWCKKGRGVGGAALGFTGGAAAGRPRTMAIIRLPCCHDVWNKAIRTAHQAWEIWVNSNATAEESVGWWDQSVDRRVVSHFKSKNYSQVSISNVPLNIIPNRWFSRSFSDLVWGQFSKEASYDCSFFSAYLNSRQL